MNEVTKTELLLREKIERLRELITYIHDSGHIPPSLWDRVVKEMGDE